MDLDWHAMNLGKIIGNLQSLEMAIRMTIGAIDKSRRFAADFSTLNVGDHVPSDALTSYDSLRPTVRLYNGLVCPEDRLDVEGLVALRDTLAHGRVMNREPTVPIRLVKFGKEQNGTVVVEAVVEMSESWFAEQREFVYRCIEMVAAVNQKVADER